MFHGSMVALVTPMKTGMNEVDFPALGRLVEFHIEQGTDAIVAVGTTGESATLNAEEHCQVIQYVVNAVHGKIPVIAGTGANCTREAIELTKYAMTAGADACLLVTPYYNKPTQEGLFQHYKKIAEAVAIPQILYNVPGRTACDLLPETVARLAGIPNIVGIKEATGEIERARQILDSCDGQMDVYSGDDFTTRELINNGAKGAISVTANVAPAAMHEMCALALAGEDEKSKIIDEGLVGLHQALFVEANPIPVKWALQRMGHIEEAIRLPLTWLTDDKQAAVEAALKNANLI